MPPPPLAPPASPQAAAPDAIDLAFVDEAIARLGNTPDAVIPLLQAIQDHYGWLPETALRRIAATTRILPSSITGVATFYDMFRHQPVGKHVVHVCHGTACHVGGADRIEDALRRHLRIAPGAHTDPDRLFTLESVACLGCCTLAPVVKIEDHIAQATTEKVPDILRDFLASRTRPVSPQSPAPAAPPPDGAAQIQVCLDSCCVAKGTDRIFHILQETIARTGAPVTVKRVGCVGACYRTPMIEIAGPSQSPRAYTDLSPARARTLVEAQFRPRGWQRRVSRWWARAIDGVLLDDPAAPIAARPRALPERDAGTRAFFGRQVHIAMEHYGRLDPLDLDEYLAHDGFAGLRRCLNELPPSHIVDLVDQSGLRGRGGAGFPTGQKWRMVHRQAGDTKYVICNGDEGDPGAFMDRMILESFPYRVIEGLAIAAVATGAHDAIFYIRHEYPQALKRVRAALAECERRGWLGARLMGAAYPLRVVIKEGAGAFVCGEETALIASIEGRRGMPRLRPPFPAQSGLRGKPTLINNVETLALVPWVLRHGPQAFAAIGTRTSKGTKVFALAGRVRRAGLIEVPMGTTIRDIVEDIGGGVPDGRKFKAVQIGGPSGGCLPARLADTPVDYESLRDVGAIMGSGGLVVLDDTACMVDIARYFLQFTQNQSCGKCTFCRIGTKRMLELLELLCAGRAQRRDLAELEHLAVQVSQSSLCGLGKTAPNPVLTTLRYYRDEYEAHLQGHCPAGKCPALIHYVVTPRCTGCTLCAQHCPVDAIPLAPYRQHAINDTLCIRCDACRVVCPHDAIDVKS
ncbi:MAG: NAD(P)H-dependent oxidoreductase subunit E [Verrucomicrobia bacterium]|nr:NAD(P)H-dependent oxidoreductase subunit E [Verrucomicrobiota bacterium]